MGNDDVPAAIAHIGLACMAGYCLNHAYSRTYAFPGMHINFLIHGILGFFNNQSNLLGNDFKQVYDISKSASQCLALPSLMGDFYRSDDLLSILHLLSGIIPFVMALLGTNDPNIARVAIACNIISLCIHSNKYRRDWGWFTAGASVLAYFVTALGPEKAVYPLGLALVEYCAHRAQYLFLASA